MEHSTPPRKLSPRMYNPLVEMPCREWHGYLLNIDFVTWARYKIAIKNGSEEERLAAYFSLFAEMPPDIEKALADMPLVTAWMITATKEADEEDEGEEPTPKEPYCFAHDGAVIWAEMWRHFPLLMQRGVSWHEGVAMINDILSMPTENSQLAFLAYARTGDFSQLSKNQREFWQRARTRHALPMGENEKQEQAAVLEVLRGNGDFSNEKDD